MTPDLMSNSPFDFNTDKENWKENLAVHQKSLGALFQAPVQLKYMLILQVAYYKLLIHNGHIQCHQRGVWYSSTEYILHKND